MQTQPIVITQGQLRTDIPRNTPRVRLEIEVAPWTCGQMIAGGHFVAPDKVPDGNGQKLVQTKVVVEVYEDEVASVEKLVQANTDRLRSSQEAFGIKLAAYNAEMREKGADPAKVLIPWSLEAEYYSTWKEDIKPFLSVKRIKDEAPTQNTAAKR